MDESRHKSEPPTVDRIRADISDGATREKVEFPDPSAVPLGTDDEAAGKPASYEERRLEAQARPNPRPPSPPSRGPITFYFGLAAGLALIFVIGAYLLR